MRTSHHALAIRTTVAGLSLLVASCAGRDTAPAGGEPGGTLVVSTAVEPGTLLPVISDGTASQMVTDQLFDHLAEIGDSLNTTGDRDFRPRLARSWTWAPDSMSIAFHLDSAARFHDGKPVRAEDVRFSFRLYTEPAVESPTAPLLSNIDSVSLRDSLTPVFWFKRRMPTQFFDAAYQMVVHPAHLLASVPMTHAALAASPYSRHPIGSGRFRFVKWEPKSRLEIVADTANYRGRAKLDRVIWTIAQDPSSAVIKLFTNDADFLETLRPEHVSQAATNTDLQLIPYPALDYGYMAFNMRDRKAHNRPHPIFSDPAVRRALTMAIDRQRLLRNVFDTLAYVPSGALPRAVFAGAKQVKQIAYDLPAARLLLDSLGWLDTNGDGVRRKNGVPLEFSVLVPSTSSTRARYAVLLQEQLRQVGAKLNVETLDITPFLQRLGARDFDAALGSWHVDPSPGSLRQTWGIAGARADGGSNAGAYENPVFDALVDSALTALDKAKSDRYWERAIQVIVDDAPAVFLYEPRLVAGASKRLRISGVRPDAWWAGLSDWWIPKSERNARDRIGLRDAEQ